MKISKFLLLTFSLLIFASLAEAQQPPATAPQTPGVPGGLKGKLALINTGMLQDAIDEFRAKREALNKQFEPRVREAELLAQQIQTRENTLQTQGDALTPAKKAELTEQIASLKRDYQRKAEDLEADGTRARDLALKPISEKLDRFAREYAAKRGITILVDLANAYNSGHLVWYDQRLDITQDFVKEYNKANPVAGAAPPAANPAKPQ
ncbi:MAG: OmpH family outer membrane protein [Acidobacteriota bacterium]